MSIVDTGTLFSVTARNVTAAAEPGSLADVNAHRTQWDSLIDTYLIDWGLHPDRWDEQDVEPPSSGVIALACNIAQFLRNNGWPAPLRVVPDGDGGIVFERRHGDILESLGIMADESVELNTFRDCRLVHCVRLA